MLHGLLPELIVPAVRSKTPELREGGIVCLGLICLIDKVRRPRAPLRSACSPQSDPTVLTPLTQKSAAPTFSGLFLTQAQAAQGPLKIQILQIIFDMLMVYDISSLLPNNSDVRSSSLSR